VDQNSKSQNLLIVKDLCKLKTDLNFSDMIFNTQNLFEFFRFDF